MGAGAVDVVMGGSFVMVEWFGGTCAGAGPVGAASGRGQWWPSACWGRAAGEDASLAGGAAGLQRGQEDVVHEKFAVGGVGGQSVEPAHQEGCTGHLLVGEGVGVGGKLATSDRSLQDVLR